MGNFSSRWRTIVLISLDSVKCYSVHKTFMVLCIDIFKCLDFVGIQSWVTLHLTSWRKNRKGIIIALLNKYKKRPLQKVFTPLHPPAFSLAETMSLHYLTVILPPWWFSLAFFTSLVWTDAAPRLLPHSLDCHIRVGQCGKPLLH